MPDATPPDQRPGRLSGIARLDLTRGDQHAARVEAHALASYAVGWQVHITVGEHTPHTLSGDLPDAFATALLAGVHLVFDGSIDAVAAWLRLVRAHVDHRQAASSRRGRHLRAVMTA